MKKASRAKIAAMGSSGRLQMSACVLLAAAVLAGCTSTGRESRNAFAVSGPLSAPVMKVCSGYGCILEDRFSFSQAETAELKALFEPATGPEGERLAIQKAIGRMEQMARRHLRYRPDIKKAYQKNAGKRGQMDCVDESLNTTSYLKFLDGRGFLKHHKPRRRFAERGFLVDGRYPHKSAVIVDAAGTEWTVDSWYEGDGSQPQIMRLRAWKKVRDSFQLG